MEIQMEQMGVYYAIAARIRWNRIRMPLQRMRYVFHVIRFIEIFNGTNFQRKKNLSKRNHPIRIRKIYQQMQQ